ncbi:MAG: hypothetical protein CSYNP_03416 [Syntrophus sp. SKADARSKE-3]|nr:hypothetical protein [Syntrophus sp. SKADARSKE-3]
MKAIFDFYEIILKNPLRKRGFFLLQSAVLMYDS